MDKQQQELLTAIISQFYSLSSSSYKLIIENCTIGTYSKLEHLCIEGKSNAFEYFLLEGLVHRYNSNQINAVTTGFYISPSIITPNFARTIKGKSLFFIQALTDCIIAQIPVPLLDQLRYQHEDIRMFGQNVVEHELIKSIKSEISFRVNKAKDRLLLLRKEVPNIENLIPHTTIASYLGLTPVSLSRLRNELASVK